MSLLHLKKPAYFLLYKHIYTYLNVAGGGGCILSDATLS